MMVRFGISITAVVTLISTALASDRSQQLFYSRSGVEVENTGELIGKSSEIWTGISFVLHRNGEPDPCGSPIDALQTVIPKVLGNVSAMPDDKYDVESVLTYTFAENVNGCGSVDDKSAPEGLSGYCDMGEARTPILLDHASLVRLPNGYLPCRWFTREGLRISSLEQLQDLAFQAKEKAQTCSTSNPQDASESCTS